MKNKFFNILFFYIYIKDIIKMNKQVLDTNVAIENNTVPTVHFSNLIIIHDQDDQYFYGTYRENEYSVDKENFSVCIKNIENNNWDTIQNPFVFLTEEIQKDILIKNISFNNFMLNQQIISLNLEISRLQTQELAPLKSALEQANFTIERFIHTKGSGKRFENDGLLQSFNRAQNKIEEQKIYIMRLKNQINKINVDNGINKIDTESEDFEIELKKQLEAKCKTFMEQIELLGSKLIQKEKEFDELTLRFNNLDQNFNELNLKHNSKISEFDALNNDFVQSKSKISSLENEILSKIQEIQNLNSKLVSKSIEFDKIQVSFESKNNENNELKKQIKNLDKTIQELRFNPEKDNEINNLRQRISVLEQEKVQQKNRFTTQLQEQIQEQTRNLEKELEKYRIIANEKDRELTKLRQEHKKLLKSTKDYESDMSLMKTATKTIQEESKTEIQNLNQQINDKTTQINTLTDKNMRIEKQFRKALEELQKSRKDIESMEKNYISVVQNYDEENNKLRYEIKSCRDKVKLYHEVSNKSIEQLKSVIRREKILKNALAKYEGKPTDEENHEFVGNVIENIVRNSIESYNNNLQHMVSDNVPPSEVQVN